MGLMLEISKQDELINDYYTPFIKSKLNNKKEDYSKMIKELDKHLDRIKAVYIKGILKLEDFDKEIKHIEFQKTEIIKKQQEQKQYDNLSFTVDDLLILQDKQEIDTFSNPTELLNSIYNWYDLSKENKQKLIGKYIDNLIIEKKDKFKNVITGNFRESYLKEMMHNHDKYDIPYSWNIFEDDYGFKISMNHELKTKEQARNYFNKLTETLDTDYKLKYYEVETDDDLKNINFKTEADIEKVIRLIALKRDNKYTKGNLKLGVITIDLSDIKDKNGKQIYDEYFKKLKEKIVQ